MRGPFLRYGGRLGILAVVAAGLAVGCKPSDGIGKTVPVQGKVTWGGEPLTAGMIVFRPEGGGDNASALQSSGTIGADGTYTLTTTTVAGATAKGAPLGKYKVTVTVNMPPMGTGPVVAPPAIDPSYTNAARTPLSVEVVESPAAGAYDLSLKK